MQREERSSLYLAAETGVVQKGVVFASSCGSGLLTGLKKTEEQLDCIEPKHAGKPGYDIYSLLGLVQDADHRWLSCPEANWYSKASSEILFFATEQPCPDFLVGKISDQYQFLNHALAVS